jgi:hypothetical protein
MEKWSQSLHRRLTKLEQKIESLLIMDLENQDTRTLARFEPLHDSKIIRTLSRELPEDIEDRTIIVFSKLSIFFEVGVLLERESDNWKAQAYFQNGRLASLTADSLEVKGAPALSPLQIVKAPALPFLKQLKIAPTTENPEDLAAFLLRPHESVSFLLMTRLVGPWLKNHMDEIHKEILKAFA